MDALTKSRKEKGGVLSLIALLLMMERRIGRAWKHVAYPLMVW